MRHLSIRCRCFALLLLLLSGCSAVRLVYNQADVFLAWKVNEYFDLDAHQKQAFNARLMPLLAWHRQDQLPVYVKLLAETQQRVQRPVTRDDGHWLVENIKARYRVAAARSTPDMADLLFMLTPDNLRELERKFARDNRKFTDEFKLNGSADEQRRERFDRMVKRIRDWTGPLTAAQLERARGLSDALPLTDHLRLQDRQRRQKEFLALMAHRQNKAEFARTLDAWLADWEKGRPPQAEAVLNEGYEKRLTLYLEVANSLNGEQRKHVHEKLQSYIDDMRGLSTVHAMSATGALLASLQ